MYTSLDFVFVPEVCSDESKAVIGLTILEHRAAVVHWAGLTTQKLTHEMTYMYTRCQDVGLLHGACV